MISFTSKYYLNIGCAVAVFWLLTTHLSSVQNADVLEMVISDNSQAIRDGINYDPLYSISRKIVRQELQKDDLKEKGSEKALKQKKQLKKQRKADSSWTPIIIFSLMVALLVFYVFFFKEKMKKPANSGNGLKEDEVEALKTALEHTMVSEKPYLNKDLSLNELAFLVGTSDKKMSMLLNQHLNTNFYDYINKFRVEEFIAQLKLDEHKNYSIEGIALNSGFKSKSSFYRIFKKEMKVSPLEFKKSLEKN